MKRKTVFHIMTPVLLVLALVLGTWRSTAAAIITNDTHSIGRQGIFVPGGFSPDNIQLTRLSQNEFRGGPVVFTRPMLRVRYINNAGREVGFPFALTYVFYNLHGFEQREWEEGELGIWYRDNATNQWRSCNAFQTKLANGDARIACVATQGTVFGLGRAR